MFSYFLFNKPYQTLCQFSESGQKSTLANYMNIKKDIYPIGRLDYDSEGLLLLTDDGLLHNLLINPKFSHSRKYFAQVEKIPDKTAINNLSSGVMIEKKMTKKANVFLPEPEPILWERKPPVRFRKNIPTSWLELELFEGRNRQIRKMTAAVGHPTLRLIRTQILFLTLNDLLPGNYRELTKIELNKMNNLLSEKFDGKI